MAPAVDDKEQLIIRLLKNGDSGANEMIYRTYAPFLTGVCARYLSDSDDVKDLLHDTFINIFSSVNTAFTYRGPGSLKAWLSRIAVNNALKHIRSRYNLNFIALSPEESDIPEEDPDIENIPLSAIHSMIRELPPGYRTVFNLYLFERKSHKEIAKLLNISEGTSASQFHRAKKMLADKINLYKQSKDPSVYGK